MKHTPVHLAPLPRPRRSRARPLAGAALWCLSGVILLAAGMAQVVPAGAQETAQADRGADTFFFYCSTCHGRRGEGLTDEFRSQMPPGETNCWQSKCHAPNHPPEGFVFPKYVPALIGDGTLGAFDTAQDLYDFISVNMPFQLPGGLKPELYWEIVAFLLRVHGTDLRYEVNASNAARFPMHADLLQTPSAAQIVESFDTPHDPSAARWLLGGLVFVIALATGMLFQALWFQRRSGPRV